jgi:SAM-dependent methyltransferase
MNPYNAHYTAYQQDANFLQRLFRCYHVQYIVKQTTGRTIDFGCGIGNVLKRLPHGSVGFEINDSAVAYCRKMGLDVRLYNPLEDNYEFRECMPGQFETFVMLHVLEHLEEPGRILGKILNSCGRLNIKKIIIEVPGQKGFHFDPTHKVYVDRAFFYNNGLNNVSGYSITRMLYFPLNCERACRIFTHNGLIVTYEQTS